MHNQEVNEQKVRELTEELSAKLDVYDKILSKQRYVAGDVGVNSHN